MSHVYLGRPSPGNRHNPLHVDRIGQVERDPRRPWARPLPLSGNLTSRPLANTQSGEWIALALATPLFIVVGLLAGVDPRLALIAAVGLAFVLLALTDLAVALVLLIVIIFVETAPEGGSVVSMTKLAGLTLALGWLVRLATQPAGRERLILGDHPALSYLLALFLTWVLVSSTWAGNAGSALDQASSFLLVAVLYVIVYTAVGTRRQAILVLGGFTFGTALVAGWGLVTRPSLETVEAGRLVSTVEDPNFLAASLIAGIALAGAGILAFRDAPALRIGSLTALTLCLSAFALTGSRGGIVGLTVAMVAAILFGGRWRGKIALAVAVVALSGVAYYTLFAPPEITERIEIATQGETSQLDSRTTIWTVAWRMVEDNPVRGVGVGNFEHESINYVLEPGTTFRTDRVIDNPGVSHNTFLGPLAELGAIGALLFVSFIGLSIACAVRAARQFAENRDLTMEALSRGLVVACFGILAAGFFISAETSKIVWLLLALGPALLGLARAGTARRHSRPTA